MTEMKNNNFTTDIRDRFGAELALERADLFGNEEKGVTPNFHFTCAAAERDDRLGDPADRWLKAAEAGNIAAMAAAEAAAVAEAEAGILY